MGVGESRSELVLCIAQCGGELLTAVCAAKHAYHAVSELSYSMIAVWWQALIRLEQLFNWCKQRGVDWVILQLYNLYL